ncbi:hypothetical protein J1G42_14290 [Cellulomonas sp. zg-ZUI222]|uniref:hypothetical protein n=1 Tax=Cellulomonas TaxID=1707 RepID=UPI001A9430C5|nr:MULTISPECIES: hypothetical protein [Cellulomonas]MBO0901753.1 hypothetical protein [Cellulomonas sp. zg-ZUI22]MBO0921991.1 hypothetical protein [Cellulomonas wangleii]
MELIVEDLTTLARLRRPGTRSTIRRVRLHGALADPVLERRLNTAYFACGCKTGSAAVSLTMAVSVLLGILQGFAGPWALWRILLYLAAAALLGKAVGLVGSRVELRRIYRRLDAALVNDRR